MAQTGRTARAIALTIAGSDSSAGAGIAADLKTFAAFEVYGASVITALTAQNTNGVSAIHAVPADFVAAQMDAVFSDLEFGAVKIGMLANAAIADAVAAGLVRHRARNVVLDPVMAASSGESLLAGEAGDSLRRLLSLSLLVTPNLPEAAALLRAPLARNEDDMRTQAQRLLAFGSQAVLIKGGHLETSESVDLLVDANGCERFAAPRVATKNTHGTGCTLSSAVAAGLARGRKLGDAVRDAKVYVTEAIAAADRLGVGTGRGPLHHFFRWW